VRARLDHVVIHVSDWARANAPDGSLLEFISYG
jgi:hypothetical protein